MDVAEDAKKNLRESAEVWLTVPDDVLLAAGIPAEVLTLAREVLAELEERHMSAAEVKPAKGPKKPYKI